MTIGAGEGNVPDNARLLRGVQATLRKIGKLVVDEQARMEMNAVDIVLSELAARQERDFYMDHYHELRSLLEGGLESFAPKITAGADEAIRRDLVSTLPATLDPMLDFESIAAGINLLKRHLALLMRDLSPQDGSATEFLHRVAACENEFHGHRVRYSNTRTLAEPDAAVSLDAEKLTQYLRDKFPERRGLRVTQFRQLVGGFQKTTVLFETDDDSDRHDSLVLRAEKIDKFVALDASNIADEHRIVRFLHDAGAAVAEPLWFEADALKLGQRFFVSRRLPGTNYGSAIGNSEIMADDVVRSFVETIARVHMLPVTEEMRTLSIGRWLDFPSTQDNFRANIRFWRDQLWMDGGNPSPIADRLTAWLIENAPEGDIPLCLVHCDYGLHNSLVHEGRVSGIVDWESCRIGDPAEDIAWLLQGNVGNIDYGKVAGWYEEITGHRISEFRLRYYNVMLCLKLLVAGMSAEAMYQHNEGASIVWLILSYRYTWYGTSTFEERIRLAEAARSTQSTAGR